ncbi:uncharacterized protein K489DRAFT_377161 [Dissoconium aciculare CBS 342.82]|uniref:Stress response protein ish1 n=1 Tax=Dissoconium aciculare CBS 342.82 TaxID=1314786 RepID=A0A6J3MFT7_9PEZI|nr:uncharacterized protein K489DRAFT_377161 [Dissoconium aciculare CBS 342.82]KAF1826718.1 hypothetical protein K489DRAFT_377161 [Dissoconium aciculare CBS 342.82]
MKFSFTTLAVAALATSVAADGWFGTPHRVAYNKWHETELERWLDDYSIPHPKAADRKDLEDLVKKNWENNVIKPYNSWDVKQLTNYLTSKGYEAKKGTEKNAKSLISQVQGYWTSTEAQADEAYSNVQSWVFNTWTESQLKSFLDYHGIPNPSPRTRDSLLHTVRSNYQSIATKAGETAAYPGDWLYTSWSESDLKSWLDQRGVPVPQPSSRDKLIATIRRNAYLASQRASENYASATSAAAGAQQSLSDALLESWSDSQIKEWADKNGIKVPQGSKRNELIALARKHSASLTGNNVASSASSAYGAATSSVGNYYPQGTNAVYNQARYYYDYALNQIGFASAEAKASLSSASVEAAKTASSASRSGSSASSVASKSSSSASVAASKSASSAASVASKSGSTAASVASKSGSSAASVASKSAASAASVASNSVSSAGKQASKSAKSAGKVASSVYQKATDRVKEEL